MTFKFLTLVKYTKSIILNCVFSFLYDSSTIQTFPSFKVDEMVKKGLHHHEATTFRAPHTILLSSYSAFDSED